MSSTEPVETISASTGSDHPIETPLKCSNRIGHSRSPKLGSPRHQNARMLLPAMFPFSMRWNPLHVNFSRAEYRYCPDVPALQGRCISFVLNRKSAQRRIQTQNFVAQGHAC